MAISSVNLKNACIPGTFQAVQQFRNNVNSRDEVGNFLLGRFVEVEPFTEEHKITLPLIIGELGADVNLTHNKTGATALHVAAMFGNLSAIKILIKHRATVDASDSSGSTPLAACAQFEGNSSVIEYLLKKNASINSRSKERSTALHKAVAQGQVENTRTLLINGADKNVLDSRGNAPIVMADFIDDRNLLRQMRELFNKTREQLIEERPRSTNRLTLLLEKENPLQEAIESRNREEADILMANLTQAKLINGFRFAFNDAKFHGDFIFELFRNKVPDLVEEINKIIQSKTTYISSLEDNLAKERQELEFLSTPMNFDLTADDFEIGRGNMADQASAFLQFQDYQRMRNNKGYLEQERKNNIEILNKKISFSRAELAKAQQQIETLNQLLQLH